MAFTNIDSDTKRILERIALAQEGQLKIAEQLAEQHRRIVAVQERSLQIQEIYLKLMANKVCQDEGTSDEPKQY